MTFGSILQTFNVTFSALAQVTTVGVGGISFSGSYGAFYNAKFVNITSREKTQGAALDILDTSQVFFGR